jgi:hypothetical protein
MTTQKRIVMIELSRVQKSAVGSVRVPRWDLISYAIRESGRRWTKYLLHLNICQSRLTQTLSAGMNLPLLRAYLSTFRLHVLEEMRTGLLYTHGTQDPELENPSQLRNFARTQVSFARGSFQQADARGAPLHKRLVSFPRGEISLIQDGLDDWLDICELFSDR